MTTAFDRLADAVDRAKAGQPLASVTVVVPGHASGRDVLHHLARTRSVANTNVLAVAQVVTKLAAPVLAPRRPMPYPLLEAAVQRVLAQSPGVFAEVADETITAQALAAAAWELTGIAEPGIPVPTRLVADLLRVYRAAIASLADSYYLQHEAFAAAAGNLHRLGAVIVFAPAESTAAGREFLNCLQAVGETVDLDLELAPTQVIHAPDADDEVRAVTRLVRKHLAAGTPGHRIGIFYGSEDPYLPLLHEHLTAGCVAFSAPECHTLMDRPVGRALLGLLALDHERMPRGELLTLLAEGALCRPEVDGRPVSQRKLELLTRRIEPTVGGDDWDRLTRVAADEHHHDLARALHAYVTALQSDLIATATASDWATVAQRLEHLLGNYFRIPAGETAALDLATVRSDCAGLAHMDGIAPPPSPARVLDALTVRLRAHREMHGSAGKGIGVAPIATGVGRDHDVAIAVGAAEGTVPAPRREDPLLPPELVGITSRDYMEHQRHAFVSAVGAGRVARVVTFPRGSLRGGAEKVPSRWLIPTLGRLAGVDVDVVRWQRQTENASAIVAVESFDVAAQRGDDRIGASAASETEWRLRELAAVPANRRRGTLDDPVVNLGMEMRSDRLNGRFTRFNGNVAAARHLITVFDRPVSPTALETWVKSPYQYFLEHILNLKGLDDPDEIAQIDPLTRGNLVHTILERYVLETIGGAELDADRLRRTAQEVLDEAEADSPGWLAQLWFKDRGVIARDLDDWFDHDLSDHRDGWFPTHAEQDFGTEPLVELDLGGATISFRGQIDRIDSGLDGTTRVTDYKTGQAKFYRNLTAQTPTNDGRQFQLPVYGLFARTLGENVSARYWFITNKGEFTDIGYPVTNDVVTALAADMTLVHASITAGHFPPKIEDTNWELPVVDLIGRPGLQRAWANLENVDELDAYVQKYGG